jgi:hypothetical protein
MPVDPLSPATRNAKRNLLVASVLTITYEAFDVTISKIPIAGLSIDFDNRLFGFLLFATMTYFSLTFLLYYAIDINNISSTPHQDNVENTYKSHLQSFPDYISSGLLHAIKTKLPDNTTISSPAKLNTELLTAHNDNKIPTAANIMSAIIIVRRENDTYVTVKDNDVRDIIKNETEKMIFGTE